MFPKALAIVATLGALAHIQAFAADADPATSDAVAGIEEVQVSARRRLETAQDVPLAVSVLSGQAIEATGSFNVSRLQQLQPSLQFISSNPRNTAVNIRGLGAPFGLTNDGIEQGVGVYIDEVYNARVAATTFDFLDVEQIEVLRGPQGTLYGKNTTAGAINITTRKPTRTPEGSLEVSTGNLGFVQARAALSGPLGEALAGRVAVSGTQRDGTFENVFSGSEVNEIDNVGTRAQLLWEPSGELQVTLSGDFNRQNPECCAQVFVGTHPNLRAPERRFAALAAASGYQVPSNDPFDRLVDADTPLEAKQSFGGASLRAVWDVGFADVTSVTAWRFWDWEPSNDRDFTGLPITTISANPSEQVQWSQEVRLASRGNNTIDYVAGVFAFYQNIESSGVQQQGSAASLWLLGPSRGGDPRLLDGLRQDTDIDYDNYSVAFFTRLTWHVIERLRLEPGLRVNYDDKSADYAAVASGGLATTDPALIALQRGVLQSQSYVAKFSDWDAAYDATLSYDVTNSALGYVTYARTFKSGGINLSGIPNRPDGTPNTDVAAVAPETVHHVEVGLKSRWFDDRATVNLALFRTEIDDYQATVVNGAIGTLRGFLANAEEVRSQGVELDFNLRPAPSWQVYANVAYTDAEYSKFESAPPPPELGGGDVSSVDISGQTLPGVSDWSLSWGGEYHRPGSLLGTTGEFFAGLDGSFRSNWNSNPTPSRYFVVDEYALTNLRAGYRADGGWEAWAWVRNAFDAEYFDFLNQPGGNLGMITGQPGDPRTYGVTLRVSL